MTSISTGRLWVKEIAQVTRESPMPGGERQEKQSRGPGRAVTCSPERWLEVLVPGCTYSQLSISREQVCVSRGNLLKSMLHIAVTVTLETKRHMASAPAEDRCEMIGKQKRPHFLSPVPKQHVDIRKDP